jgi:hypothetical protein
LKFPFSDWFGGGSAARRIDFPATDRPTYRAVGIRPGAVCCQGSVQMSEKRFLVGKAPMLPLPGCDAAQCDCRYAHYSDRRYAGTDRRRTVASAGEAVVPFERRQSNGRRSTDARF